LEDRLGAGFINTNTTNTRQHMKTLDVELERFEVVRNEHGQWHCQPLGSADALLRVLYGDVEHPAPWDEYPVHGDSAQSVRDHLFECAASWPARVGLRVEAEQEGRVTFAAFDLAAASIDLAPALAEAGLPVRSAQWTANGEVRVGGRRVLTVERGDPLRVTTKAEIRRVTGKLKAHYRKRFGKETPIWSMSELLAIDGDESFWRFGRSLYKCTDCGPWVVALCTGREDVYYEGHPAGEDDWHASCVGIRIGSIVEGSDVEVGPEELLFPFTESELDRVVKQIDDEADFYWKRDNIRSYYVTFPGGECTYIDESDFDEPSVADGDEVPKGIDRGALLAAITKLDIYDYEAHPVPGFAGVEVKMLDKGDMCYW
jgi:hypothetical protein